jgi:hypothetical protein
MFDVNKGKVLGSITESTSMMVPVGEWWIAMFRGWVEVTMFSCRWSWEEG